MPYIANESETVTVSVQQEQEHEIDTYNMDSLNIMFDHNDPTQIRVNCSYSKGYIEESTFVPIKRYKVLLSGVNLLTAFAGLSDPAKSNYDNMREVVWNVLQTEGHIPEGTLL